MKERETAAISEASFGPARAAALQRPNVRRKLNKPAVPSPPFAVALLRGGTGTAEKGEQGLEGDRKRGGDMALGRT